MLEQIRRFIVGIGDVIDIEIEYTQHHITTFNLQLRVINYFSFIRIFFVICFCFFPFQLKSIHTMQISNIWSWTKNKSSTKNTVSSFHFLCLFAYSFLFGTFSTIVYRHKKRKKKARQIEEACLLAAIDELLDLSFLLHLLLTVDKCWIFGYQNSHFD